MYLPTVGMHGSCMWMYMDYSGESGFVALWGGSTHPLPTHPNPPRSGQYLPSTSEQLVYVVSEGVAGCSRGHTRQMLRTAPGSGVVVLVHKRT